MKDVCIGSLIFSPKNRNNAVTIHWGTAYCLNQGALEYGLKTQALEILLLNCSRSSTNLCAQNKFLKFFFSYQTIGRSCCVHKKSLEQKFQSNGILVIFLLTSFPKYHGCHSCCIGTPSLQNKAKWKLYNFIFLKRPDKLDSVIVPMLDSDSTNSLYNRQVSVLGSHFSLKIKRNSVSRNHPKIWEK